MGKEQGGNDEHIEEPQPRGVFGDGIQDPSSRSSDQERQDIVRHQQLANSGGDDGSVDDQSAETEEPVGERTGHYMEVSSLHSGPIPDPDTLGRYGLISSDFPERIVRMAEIELETKTEIAKKLAQADAFSTKMGMSGFLMLVALGIIGAFVGGVVMRIPEAFWFLSLPALSGMPRIIEAIKAGSSKSEE